MAAELEPKPLLVAPSWIEAHCAVPDGFRKGDVFRLYDYQLLYLSSFYLVRGDVEFDRANPVRGPAFVHRRGLLIGPQKLGKGPLTAAHVCAEGVGPVLFAGWAGKDAGYSCRDFGCGCGWEYAYDRGEPMGMPWPTPLVQITAFSEEQTDNIYDALRPMIEEGPLADLIPKTGEEFIRLPGGGRIDVVTASAQSRLGQRITFVPQDEVGIWTAANKMTRVADTQYRGLAGMGGRASLTSNAWDPSERSVAQLQFESRAKDIYRQFTQPPAKLSYQNKRDRKKIHRAVYPADTLRENGGHVDLDAIENEAHDLLARDPAQAERFFGNRIVTGTDAAFDPALWKALARPRELELNAKLYAGLKKKDLATLGFDGARFRDATGLITTHVETGLQLVAGVWERPDTVTEDRWEVPEFGAGSVDEAVEAAFDEWEIWRFYGDPPYWESAFDRWTGKYGEQRVIAWWTNRSKFMAYALKAFLTAMQTAELAHDGNEAYARHIANARKLETRMRDEDGKPLWVIRKERPDSPLKIDLAMAGCLSWEARGDALAAGANKRKQFRTAGF